MDAAEFERTIHRSGLVASRRTAKRVSSFIKRRSTDDPGMLAHDILDAGLAASMEDAARITALAFAWVNSEPVH